MKHPGSRYSWLAVRVGSLFFAAATGFWLASGLATTHDLDFPHALLAGAFCFAGINIMQWVHHRKDPPILETRIRKPSWLLPISGSIQVLDFGGWYLVLIGTSSAFRLWRAGNGMGGGIFFITMGFVILTLNWIGYFLFVEPDDG